MRRLQFGVTGQRRQGAEPRLAKMYRVPPAEAWRHAIGASLERALGVGAELTITQRTDYWRDCPAYLSSDLPVETCRGRVADRD
jgi:hypothetical protein